MSKSTNLILGSQTKLAEELIKLISKSMWSLVSEIFMFQTIKTSIRLQAYVCGQQFFPKTQQLNAK